MTNEEFAEYAAAKMQEDLRKKYPEAKVELNTVRRNNRYKVDNIIFRLFDSYYGIGMDLEDLFDLNKEGINPDEALDELLGHVVSELLSIKPENLVHYKDWESVKENITAALLPKKEALQFQEEFPFRQLQGTDLYIFYGIRNFSDKRKLPTPIDHNMMETWKVNEDELYNLAVSHLSWIGLKMNACIPLIGNKKPIEMPVSLEETRAHLPSKIFYKLTTEENPCGAAVILIPGILERIKEKLDGNFRVIPFNVSELLLFREEESIDDIRSAITSMEIPLQEDEILSNKIYTYKNGLLTTLPDVWTEGIADIPVKEEEMEEDMELSR